MSQIAETIAAALHVAADRVWPETGTPFMNALAEAGAIFIRESNLADESGESFDIDPQSLGYGIMLGYLAARELGPLRPERMGSQG
jgi:hypothetical protein